MTESPKPGEWYLTIRCKACGKRSVLAHDVDSKVASGGVRLRIEDDGYVNIKCADPGCGQIRQYNRQEIESIQA
jgi:phage FluMu protein Com